MTRSLDLVRDVIRQAFKRISSDGHDPVSASFTQDAIYDFPYSDVYIRGSANLDIVFSQILPRVLHQLRQWPIAVYPVAGDDDTVMVEYSSHATSVHAGSAYRNRYAAVMKLSGDRIDFWREYYNVEWFDTAVGPEFPRLLAALLPSDGFALQSRDDSNVRRWKSRWVLEEFDKAPA
jgi:ketosteroid isomerase-like protein